MPGTPRATISAFGHAVNADRCDTRAAYVGRARGAGDVVSGEDQLFGVGVPMPAAGDHVWKAVFIERGDSRESTVASGERRLLTVGQRVSDL